jgi:hypothetical protein
LFFIVDKILIMDRVEAHEIRTVQQLNNLKSLTLRLKFPIFGDPDTRTIPVIQEYMKSIIEPHMSLCRLILYWSPETLERTLWQGTDIQTLDKLFSEKLPDLFPLVRLVVALDSELGLGFDEFCERVRVGMFPRCEHRGIVRCMRIGDELLGWDPFDIELERTLYA